ncbi:hypothetical protein WN55_10751 [Dufourea novaeangliae]|uniref:Uncharacterized protein n=1 Tax=Dufourea novaeangliae TaxID=178035 RepID=A0A154P9Z6_DUFNO|nr:hypothetical protein WN55_10751 [Dufourea novaeangliae]
MKDLIEVSICSLVRAHYAPSKVDTSLARLLHWTDHNNKCQDMLCSELVKQEVPRHKLG